MWMGRMESNLKCIVNRKTNEKDERIRLFSVRLSSESMFLADSGIEEGGRIRGLRGMVEMRGEAENGDAPPSHAVLGQHGRSALSCQAMQARTDDSPRLQECIDEAIIQTPPPAYPTFRIRPGIYHLRTPLRLPRRGFVLEVSRSAHLVAGEGLDSFLNCERGAKHIIVRGGHWTGAGFTFEELRSLIFDDAMVDRLPGDAIRLRHIHSFGFHDLRLSPTAPDSASIRIGAFCRNGSFGDIRATAPESGAALSFEADVPESDADDDHGPIERIDLETLRATGPGAAIRLLSTRSTIRHFRCSGIDARRAGVALAIESGGGSAPAGNIDDTQFDSIEPPASTPPFRIDARVYGLRLRGRGIELDRTDHHPRADSTAPRFRTHILLEPGEFLVTSPFGPRVHPVTGEIGAPHLGIDGALWDGRSLVETDICAWADGTVLEAADSDGPAGTHVVLDHGGGLVTRYFHLERGSLSHAAGDIVQRGSVIGHMGRTGRATGEHLHFQMERDGVPIDPLPTLMAESR